MRFTYLYFFPPHPPMGLLKIQPDGGKRATEGFMQKPLQLPPPHFKHIMPQTFLH